MAINITLYNYSKKTNSTSVPASGGAVYSCEFLEYMTIQNPMVRFNPPDANFHPWDFNYAYIDIFSRYYFIESWQYELGTWVANLQEDALASHKTQIGNTSAYVLRSSYEFNRYIADSMFPIENRFVEARYYAYSVVSGGRTSIFCEDSELGEWYIIGIIGGVSQIDASLLDTLSITAYSGSVVYFVIDKGELQRFMSYLLNNVNLFDVPTSEISAELQKQLINPLQYITSIKCVPFKPPIASYQTAQGQTQDIEFEYITLGMKQIHLPMNGSTQDKWNILKKPDVTGNIRDLPDTNSENGWIKCHEVKSVCKVHHQYARGEWVNSSPYTTMTIEVEPFGTIDVPGNSIMQADKYQEPDDPNTYFNILFKTWFDVSTGACRLAIGTMNNQMFMPFYVSTTQVAIEVPCHQTIQDVTSFMKNQNSFKAREFGSAVDLVSGIMTLGLGASSEGSKKTGVVSGLASTAKNFYQYKYEDVPNTAISLQESNMPRVSGLNSAAGSFVSFAKDMNTPIIYAFYADIAPDNNTDVGRPLYAIKQISTIPGFIKCMSPHFESASAMEGEIDAINRFMEGGFFYE